MRKRMILAMAAALASTVFIVVPAASAAPVEPVQNGKIAIVANTSSATLSTCEDIWIMDLDGTNAVNLTGDWIAGDLSGASCERDPAWSPDGRRIAFSSSRNSNGAIWIVDADGSNAVQVTTPPNANEWDSVPTWSPDGQWIAFTRGYEVFGPMYKVHPDGTGLVKISDFSDLNATYPISWAPDGTAIAYGASGASQSIGTVTPDGSSRAVVVSDGLYPRWSPDASKIVYEDSSGDVRIVNRDGSGDALFVSQGSYPVWSPDGASILYGRRNTAGTVSLFMTPIGGGPATEIPIPFQSDTVAVYEEYDWQPLPAPPAARAAVTGLVDPSQGHWYLYDSSGVQTTEFFFGNPGDFPIMGDWDCDGVETPGMYRQSDGYVYLSNSNAQGVADIKFFFGNPGDVPIAGDFNGDGCGTVSIYRPSNQTIYIINTLGENNGGLGAAEFSYVFGNPGDKPFVGDFDGDGIETVGLHRESTGLVYFRNSHSQGNADAEFIYGDPGDRIIAGDWNSDGTFSPALFRPSNTTMYFRYENTQGTADAQFVPTPNGAAWLPVSGTM